VNAPKTRYAKSGDVSIAYQVVGEGPIDVVYTSPGMISMEVYWERPSTTRYFERLTSFSRMILFDKRGAGSSDRVAVGTIEERMDDIRAVMDAADVERAALIGLSEGGPMSMLFAATYPERVSALVLYGTFARGWVPEDVRAGELAAIDKYWGQGLVMVNAFNHLPRDEAIREAARAERLCASPGAVKALVQMNWDIDVRHAVSSISVPTLILHKTLDNRVPVEAGRWIADHIPGAQLKELPGTEHVPEFSGEWELMADEIEEFLTGMRTGPVPDRVLATVLFTDIVDSTRRASELGDDAWSQLLDRHDDITKRHVERFRGRWVKHTGDGVLATFDGPARAVLCARAIGESLRPLGIEIRSGLHTGECEVRGDDVGGIAVHTAARVGALAKGGEVLVSRTVTDLVAGSGLEFEDRGEVELKGVPGTWRLFAVAP
jgi:class 3 adenylate cyclase/pimeloyl-ACP methyl ester carboxylesterase